MAPGRSQSTRSEGKEGMRKRMTLGKLLQGLGQVAELWKGTQVHGTHVMLPLNHVKGIVKEYKNYLTESLFL